MDYLPSFSTDITGDNAVVADLDRIVYGVEMYVYWKSKGKIVEGPIPAVGWGEDHGQKRNVNMTFTELIKWRNAMDMRLRALLSGAYRTAYGGNRPRDSKDNDVMRMSA